KRDKSATLQDFDEASDLQCVKTASQSPLTPSMIKGDDVTTICDDVKGACVQNVVDSMVPALLHDKNQTFIYESLYIASLFGRALIKQMDKYFNDKDEEALRDVLESSRTNARYGDTQSSYCDNGVLTISTPQDTLKVGSSSTTISHAKVLK
ncbi:hypothetical protein Tco_0431868, partial [Tanacetum coccineum]